MIGKEGKRAPPSPKPTTTTFIHSSLGSLLVGSFLGLRGVMDRSEDSSQSPSEFKVSLSITS